MQDLKIEDAYRLLGVTEKSTIIEITKAYRNLAKKYHPDSRPDDPDYAHRMMVRINEAYTVIKNYIELRSNRSFRVKEAETGSFSRGADNRYEDEIYGTDSFSRNPMWEWINRFEKERKRREELRKREYERRKKEERAFREFFERLAIEKKLERKDRGKFDILLKHTFNILHEFFKNNFHNVRYRGRPYVKVLFDDFMEKYDLLLEKSEKLSHTCESQLYRIRSRYIFDFLRSFIFDAVRIISYPAGVSASSLRMFEDAVYVSERFMYSFFSQKEPVERSVAKDLFKRALKGYEVFLKSFPDSPLLVYAEGKIDVLEKFYMAFLR